MTIEEKVNNVEAVFDALDQEIAAFEQAQRHCQFGCGKCCFKPISRRLFFEFLPFAFIFIKQIKLKTGMIN